MPSRPVPVVRPPDIELFEMELDMLAPPDARGRVPRANAIAALAIARDGNLLRLGAEVPETVADEIRHLVDLMPPAFAEAKAPAILGPLVALIGSEAGALEASLAPHFWLDPNTSFHSDVRIVRSDEGIGEAVLPYNPGNWEADDWIELVDGVFGPWAMALDGERVVSICHTPRPMTVSAAEAGVWTELEWRGRGLAPAVTAAWAAVIAPTGRHLFYSTSAHNLASQAVATKLGARLIAWKWSFVRGDARPSPYDWAPSAGTAPSLSTKMRR